MTNKTDTQMLENLALHPRLPLWAPSVLRMAAHDLGTLRADVDDSTIKNSELAEKLADTRNVVDRLSREKYSLCRALDGSYRREERLTESLDSNVKDLRDRLTKALSRESKALGRAQRAEEKLDEHADAREEYRQRWHAASRDVENAVATLVEWKQRALLAEGALDTINQLRKEGKL